MSDFKLPEISYFENKFPRKKTKSLDLRYDLHPPPQTTDKTQKMTLFITETGI